MKRQKQISVVILLSVIITGAAYGYYSYAQQRDKDLIRFKIPEMEIIAYSGLRVADVDVLATFRTYGCKEEVVTQAFKEAGFVVLPESMNIDPDCFDIKGNHPFNRMTFQGRYIEIEKNPDSAIPESKLRKLAEAIFLAH